MLNYLKDTINQSSKRGGNGRGFGSVDAAYRRATKKKRPKHTVTTNYYAMMRQAVKKNIGRRR
tara:strand:- start:479 stop:667 length:189 start_codon:yes stop_codon:yes gene_type:complete